MLRLPVTCTAGVPCLIILNSTEVENSVRTQINVLKVTNVYYIFENAQLTGISWKDTQSMDHPGWALCWAGWLWLYLSFSHTHLSESLETPTLTFRALACNKVDVDLQEKGECHSPLGPIISRF